MLILLAVFRWLLWRLSKFGNSSSLSRPQFFNPISCNVVAYQDRRLINMRTILQKKRFHAFVLFFFFYKCKPRTCHLHGLQTENNSIAIVTELRIIMRFIRRHTCRYNDNDIWRTVIVQLLAVTINANQDCVVASTQVWQL